MIVKISDALVDDFESLKKILTYISFMPDVHTLSTENEKKILAALSHDSTLSDLYKELVNKQINNVDFTKVIEITLGETDLISSKCSMGDVDKFLSRLKPVVIVENKSSDLKFLKLILNVTRNRNLAEKIGVYFSVDGPGGCGEIPKTIDYHLNLGLPGSSIFVLHDSDKLYPYESLGVSHTNIIDKCKEHNVSNHTLSRREAENYIIDDLAFNLKGDCCSFKSAWSSFRDNQKAHYDFKVGFSKLNYDDKKYDGLFENLSSEVVEVVFSGFGSDIAESAFQVDNYKFYRARKIEEWSPKVMREFKIISNSVKAIL